MYSRTRRRRSEVATEQAKRKECPLLSTTRQIGMNPNVR
jgi:hypothetical protein